MKEKVTGIVDNLNNERLATFVDCNLTEQFVVENMLNQFYSGVDENIVILKISIYFLGTGSQNALYYISLIKNCMQELDHRNIYK